MPSQNGGGDDKSDAPTADLSIALKHGFAGNQHIFADGMEERISNGDP